jgi:hypothetical protein
MKRDSFVLYVVWIHLYISKGREKCHIILGMGPKNETSGKTVWGRCLLKMEMTCFSRMSVDFQWTTPSVVSENTVVETSFSICQNGCNLNSGKIYSMLVCRLKNFCCKAKSLKALGLLYSFSQS